MSDAYSVFTDLNTRALRRPFVMPSEPVAPWLCLWLDAGTNNAAPCSEREDQGGDNWHRIFSPRQPESRWNGVVKPLAHALVQELDHIHCAASGITTIAWADQPDPSDTDNTRRLNLPHSIGNLNPQNFDELWPATFGGSRFAAPGWDFLLQAYEREFESVASQARPDLGVLAVVSGELKDPEDFTARLIRTQGQVKVLCVLPLYRNGPAALQLRSIERKLPELLRLIILPTETPPELIAIDMLRLLGQPVESEEHAL